jgi:Peptidase family M1 domain
LLALLLLFLLSMKNAKWILAFLVVNVTTIQKEYAQSNVWEDKFKQLGPELATPNEQRTASGAPGVRYWQQQVDYKMNIRIEDATQKLYGEEWITYHNLSPDGLTYLWVQLDQNNMAKESDAQKIEQSKINDKMGYNDIKDLQPWYDGGFKIVEVKDKAGKDLRVVVNQTMMRVDLPFVLKSGEVFSFKIKWWYNINDRIRLGGRSGYEYFEQDKNYLYTMAQFYPRMAAYMDYCGWQNKQFLGAGEFTLDFGNYEVNITVPDDHVVAATGELQNAKSVLSAEQLARFEKAKKSFDAPVMIINQAEAEANEKTPSDKEKTWSFKATNVRDFAFASSRKFLWDAMAVKLDHHTPLAMSFYPKEGNPLWEQYSTRAVAHTLRVYSKYTVEYAYPVAQSIHSKWIGMEYPMICFNGGRPETDGTYSEGTKYATLGVIIHEVGHNFFPMIINSDERQWTWMDEGLNTFVQYLAEKEWDANYPTRRGPARNIVDYMKGDKSKMSPIMTNSESIYQFGNNAYGKPATALNILRETIMGRELFDYAFKEYCRRWAFKHPTPEDFFRTMEDASAVDLDWFWRGWFYGTDHCDMALKEVKLFVLDSENPNVEKAKDKQVKSEAPADISLKRDREEGIKTLVEIDPATKDFYNTFDPYKVTKSDQKNYDEFLKSLSAEEKTLLDAKKYYYQLTVENTGGLIMPLIFEFKLENGTSQEFKIPAEIWKMSEPTVTKVFVLDAPAKEIVLDPHLETADVDLNNNYWPSKVIPTRFDLYKERRARGAEENEMQKAKKENQ